ncbi:LADA_0E03642g1_1 [Lachancea dasiensis]|uniref:Peptidyl-tRNA hydrolase n=1 Tax=Lachancea dasiensis TaxID=1072105 RepID=A0A1G4JBN3_9SACH|nr:LADA_0E03642g1_1 [Lachancea dasiensis]
MPRIRVPGLSRSFTTCITGIGNPEPQYACTRHNAGLFMLDLLKEELSHSSRSQPYLPCSTTKKVKKCQWGDNLLLRADGDYINLSGKTVVPLWNRLGPDFTHIVVHDELSLPVGKVQLRKPGTSVRGHNGLKDIAKRFGGGFYRLAVGIGRPAERDSESVAQYVLAKFTKEERSIIESQGLARAIDHLRRLTC